MREIKFRAWQKYHKKMVEVTSISFDDNGEINGVATFVENQAPQRISYRDGLLGRFFLKDERGMVLELMQSTGLKDKNDIEIYEGDVVRFILGDYNIREYVEEVVYSDGAFWCGNWLLFDAKVNDDDLEVLGNIYENPVLLERETE